MFHSHQNYQPHLGDSIPEILTNMMCTIRACLYDDILGLNHLAMDHQSHFRTGSMFGSDFLRFPVDISVSRGEIPQLEIQQF